MKYFKTQKQPRHRIKVLLPGLLFTSLLAAPILNAPILCAPAQAQQSDVAATVNADKILMADLNRLVNEVKSESPGLSEDTAEAKKALATLRAQILDNLIEQTLLFQEAKKRNIKIADADVMAVLKNIKESYATEKEYIDALKADGKTEADLKQMIIKDKSIAELFKQVTADVAITNVDVNEFYNKNKELFTRPEMASVRQIWVSVPDGASSADRSKAKTRANNLAQQARSNTDFGKLAFENSA
jgi:parvulin-like peptidyl-prolyl isomerase